MLLKLRLKIANFIKKHKSKILIIALVWFVIFAINYFLGHRKEEQILNTTYTPHEVLLNSDAKVPEEQQNSIENLIYDYVEKCNNKDYAGAFELLTDDCRKNAFKDSFDTFKKYAEGVFPKRKRYSIQNYSNYGEYYIYNIKIIDDIITTGLTNQEYSYYEEKIAIKQNGDKLQLCVNNYMGYEELKKVAEDDYLKVRIEDRVKYYNSEIYTIRITNKTEKDIVIYDEIAGNEISGQVGESNRQPVKVSSIIALKPSETRSFTLQFQKYYDETAKMDKISFNKVRIINNYTGQETTEEEEINKSDKVYSLAIPVE